jgi:hypothetical protein
VIPQTLIFIINTLQKTWQISTINQQETGGFFGA